MFFFTSKIFFNILIIKSESRENMGCSLYSSREKIFYILRVFWHWSWLRVFHRRNIDILCYNLCTFLLSQWAKNNIILDTSFWNVWTAENQAVRFTAHESPLIIFLRNWATTSNSIFGAGCTCCHRLKTYPVENIYKVNCSHLECALSVHFV